MMDIEQQLQDLGVVIVHHFADGLYTKEMRVPAGVQIGKHTHDFDHFSALLKGAASVEVDGVLTIHKAHKEGSFMTIKAGHEHVITALTDVVWLCIHATDETDPAHVDAVLKREGGV